MAKSFSFSIKIVQREQVNEKNYLIDFSGHCLNRRKGVLSILLSLVNGYTQVLHIHTQLSLLVFIENNLIIIPM